MKIWKSYCSLKSEINRHLTMVFNDLKLKNFIFNYIEKININKMIRVFLIALCLASIHNVNCRKSTYCPKVEPMEGFVWQPVKIFNK